MKTSPKKTGQNRRLNGALAGLAIVLMGSGYAVASGWAPFVRDDSATVPSGGTVTVLDSGARSVLANDFDIEGDAMTAVLTREADRGEVTLNGDGTFIYVHYGSSGKKDKDEFRYRAFDGTGWSREARVDIDIREADNNPPYVIDSPPAQEAIANRFYQLALAGHFDDPDEGDTLTFSASGLPSSRSLAIDAVTGILSGTPQDRDEQPSPYRVRVTARDNRGAGATLEFDLTIFADDRADLSLDARVASNPVSVGEAARWEIEVENLGSADLADGELQVQWLASSSSMSVTAPQGCTLGGNNTRNPFVQCALAGLGAGRISVFPMQVMQPVDGDYSLVAVALADDPEPGNNAWVGGGQVVEAFSEGPTQIVNVAADTLAAADLNGDGYYDVIAPTTAGSFVYFNSGNRSLTTPGTSLGQGSGGVAAVALDWNADGNMDVAIAGTANAVARVFLGDGSGGIESSFAIDTAGTGEVIAAAGADLNGDGADDLVIAGSADAVVLLSRGGNGFTARSLPGAGAIDVAIADLDNDTDRDIVLVATGDRSVRLLRNAGNGSDYTSLSLSRGSVAGVSVADINGDGDADLLLAIDGEDLELPESRVLIQRSDGTFPAGTAIGASPLIKLIPGDVDGDLSSDIVAVNSAGVHQLYRGVPGGGFQLQPEQIVSAGMRRGVLLDVNGDGSLDLILAGRAAGALEIHANNGIGRLGLGDRVAPVIALNGPASLTLASGDTYVEEGATATDDIDGDVTATVVITGSVNTAVVGTYSVTYTANDRAGNRTSTVRSVQVGVNQGTGGSGGGPISPLLLSLLALLLVVRRRQSA